MNDSVLLQLSGYFFTLMENKHDTVVDYIYCSESTWKLLKRFYYPECMDKESIWTATWRKKNSMRLGQFTITNYLCEDESFEINMDSMTAASID